MRRVRIWSVAAVYFLCALLLAGCWNRIELNELAITSATSVDRKGEDWLISFQVVIPSSISSGIGITGGGAGAPVNVYSTTGKTIREANARSFFESPRKLYFAHNRVLIVSEETARRGLNPVLDVYLRNTDARETVDVLIAPGSARRILEQMMQISKISGDGIREINHLESKFTSVLPEVKLYQLAMDLASDSGSALLPEVFVAGKSDASSLKVFESTTLPAKIKLGRVAVIKKDKMVGWLSRKESLGVAFLRNDVKNTMLTFACPNEENKYLTLQISDSSTALQPSLDEGKMTVKARIKGKAVLSQSDCSSMDLYKPEIVDELETAAEKDLQRFTNAGWKAAQRLQTDAVGFADMAHRKYRKQWREWKKDWDHYFSTIKLEVSAEITITNVGLSNQPINVNKLREGKK
ncbi:spore germination protein KC [Paenibacillus endophyticus]|uniref:Spore germination protein KC n=1 Tax=Paenibacillus endophyticus TaxID=1294268 RepID=A0A7W5C3D9_9BACL|nr:Ger(x)C family spore germination protein [Paenibacillus endophyticus]MBB3150157.1 spore germination protein KC [Paenibacillus endophyticus]